VQNPYAMITAVKLNKLRVLSNLCVKHTELKPVMLSPRGQAGLEAKILASASKLWPRPQPRPRSFGLGLASAWHGENVCRN